MPRAKLSAAEKARRRKPGSRFTHNKKRYRVSVSHRAVLVKPKVSYAKTYKTPADVRKIVKRYIKYNRKRWKSGRGDALDTGPAKLRAFNNILKQDINPLKSLYAVDPKTGQKYFIRQFHAFYRRQAKYGKK